MDKQIDLTSRLERTNVYIEQQVVDQVVAVADKSWTVLEEIKKIIQPGMLESEAILKIKKLFEQAKIDRIWHPPVARFGHNTLLQYYQPASQDLRLKEEDIAFIDIGIVFDGIEGDVGCTLAFGSNPAYIKLQHATEQLFEEGIAYWKRSSPTGIQLYEFITDLAQKMGYEFNLAPAGHLIGAYPHVGWRRGLQTYPQYPRPANWILEIQILDPKLQVGGFFEKILF